MILPSVLLLAGAASAACGDQPTQLAINQCAARDGAAADAAMAAQWRLTYAAMKRRDAADTPRGGGFSYATTTLDGQRAWLRFRDAQCAVEGAEFLGGSLQPFVRSRCLARLTRTRTAQLKDLMWQRER